MAGLLAAPVKTCFYMSVTGLVYALCLLKCMFTIVCIMYEALTISTVLVQEKIKTGSVASFREGRGPK